MCIAILHLLNPDAPFGEFDVEADGDESDGQVAVPDDPESDS